MKKYPNFHEVINGLYEILNNDHVFASKEGNTKFNNLWKELTLIVETNKGIEKEINAILQGK